MSRKAAVVSRNEDPEYMRKVLKQLENLQADGEQRGFNDEIKKEVENL